MRIALCIAATSLIALACAHDRDTNAQPATVTGAPVQSAPAGTSTPAGPVQGEYGNGSVPDRTWGTGGASEPGEPPGVGSTGAPMDMPSARDGGAAPSDTRGPNPDGLH